MAEVHIVTRAYDYEGSTAMLAFAKKEDAEAFQKLCTDYQASKPRFPDEDDEYNAYCEAEKKWRAGHPGGDYAASADAFYVETVELR